MDMVDIVDIDDIENFLQVFEKILVQIKFDIY